ncbi:hypothetical protein ACHAQA_004362 [Verticillium albo-atrum]
MDANPAPGAVPAVAGIDKVVAAEPAVPADSTGAPVKSANPFADAKPAEEKDEPSAAPKVDEPLAPAAPKPATVEDASDKGTPIATTGTENSTAIPGLSSTASAAPVPAAAAAPEPVKDAAEPADKTDVTADELVQDKPIGANGVTSPSKDTEMTGALKEGDATKAAAPAAPIAPVTEEASAPLTEKPTGSGEREAAPQAKPTNERAEVPAEDKKRKADELEPEVDGVAPANGDAKKRKPGRPPKAEANGNSNGHGAEGKEKESLGEKLVKKAKKVLPVAGKTERKTRSQGPA